MSHLNGIVVADNPLAMASVIETLLSYELTQSQISKVVEVIGTVLPKSTQNYLLINAIARFILKFKISETQMNSIFVETNISLLESTSFPQI
jgi:hypothetical protein